MNADRDRHQAGSNWRVKALLFASSATVGGGIAGAALGSIGSNLSTNNRVAIASALALVGFVVALVQLSGRSVGVLQCNRETPQAWMRYGAIAWAVVNGAALGTGMTTRIGFWLWYSIPASALLLGHPWTGLIVYGVYGASRGWSVWLLLKGPIHRISGGDPSTWLISQYWRAQTVASVYLVGLAAFVVVVVGF